MYIERYHGYDQVGRHDGYHGYDQVGRHDGYSYDQVGQPNTQPS